MAREVPEIDRLIEEGLTLYGQGNLDAALDAWERALDIDPDNPQAMSYAEYVRTNYDLLTADLGEATMEGMAPFGIADDEPEYQIEIQPGEIKATAPDPMAPHHLAPHDEGWFIDEETQDSLRGPPGIAIDQRPSQELTISISREPSQELTISLEADEPPLPEAPRPPPPRAQSAPGLDFDDATREYDKVKPRPASESNDSGEFAQDGGTPAFGHPNDFQTPPGFGTQTTGIKRRELGFVHPTGAAVAAAKPMTSTDLGLPERPRTPAKPSTPPVELPPAAIPPSRKQPTRPPDAIELEADMPELQLEIGELGEQTTTKRKPMKEEDFEELDLISSLPAPRARPRVPLIEIDTPLSGSQSAPPTKATTRDFPVETRAPAFSQTKTKELPAEPSVGKAQTQDFEAKTQERGRSLPQQGQTQDVPVMPLISAPTQDLGLRDVHRAETVNVGGRDGATRSDVHLAFDPIDARSAEILDEIDREAPPRESPEDKTRRRISALFERSSQWTLSGDHERAVAAVDLALSEDPNSALAQKLIHRNRDTIMSVFQTYLGNLDRAPQLARPLHELANAPISPRAAFLLSRIDGGLTIDEILDVCGMPRLEAYRYLCQLFLRGILR